MTPRQALRLAAVQKRRKQVAAAVAVAKARVRDVEAMRQKLPDSLKHLPIPLPDYDRPIFYNLRTNSYHFDTGEPVRNDDPRLVAMLAKRERHYVGEKQPRRFGGFGW